MFPSRVPTVGHRAPETWLGPRPCYQLQCIQHLLPWQGGDG
ncbi:hypothetical protein FQN60_011436 [Etheostoma spectabile]|uniref:Uncharacterized protein n=1 Tax=Etheostoma spectabile TaxID=54343 RepID=A0A5J5DRW2_9PERO|nr:hypothetical protein FQN60_011436 [Etheostoma spectabile]